MTKTKEKLHVTILMDNPRSWFAPYADSLTGQLEERGHTVARVAQPKDLPEGDCAFFLSVESIVPSGLLQRHTHNIVIHASPLPLGKGWSPLTWQVLEGKNEITISLFEAAEHVDSGNIYDTEIIHFDGGELIDEMREEEGGAIIALATRFIDNFPPDQGKNQVGEDSFYRRRKPEDSEIDPNKSIAEVFDQLRVADNERYPAFFNHRGNTYLLKIFKKEK